MTTADTKTKAKKTGAKKRTTRKTTARKSAKTQAHKRSASTAKNPVEAVAGIILELTRTNLDETVEAARAVLKAKDVRSAFEIQNDFVRQSFKRNVEGARELNDLATSALRQAVNPYAQRVTEAFENIRAA